MEAGADGEDRAVGPHHRAGGTFQCLDVLLQPPVHRPRRGSRVAVAAGVDQVAADAADAGIGERRQQAGHRVGREDHVGVAEHDELRRGHAHQRVHAMGLAVTLRGDHQADGAVIFAQDLRRAVAGGIDIDQQLQPGPGLAHRQHVLHLGADHPFLVVGADAEGGAGRGGGTRQPARPQPGQQAQTQRVEGERMCRQRQQQQPGQQQHRADWGCAEWGRAEWGRIEQGHAKRGRRHVGDRQRGRQHHGAASNTATGRLRDAAASLPAASRVG